MPKLTVAQKRALLEVDGNATARAYGHGRRTVYKLVEMGLVEVLTSVDASGEAMKAIEPADGW